MRQEWKIIVTCAGVLAVSLVAFPIIGKLASKGSYGERVELARQNVIANGDPDKRSFIYACLRYPSGQESNRAAAYGSSNIKLVSDENGIRTYTVDRWAAVPGPDYIQQTLTFKVRGDSVIEWRIERVAGPPDECDAITTR